MPTPLAHAASGLAVYAVAVLPQADRAEPWSATLRRDWRRVAGLAALACALDVDYLFGLPWLALNRYHQGWTHSILFAAAVAWMVILLRPGPLRAWYGGVASAALVAAVGSHLLLDLVTVDGKPPYGLPLFWPVSDVRVYPSVHLFPPVEKSGFRDLFSVWNARVILFEFVLCLPIVSGMLWFGAARRRSEGGTRAIVVPR